MFGRIRQNKLPLTERLWLLMLFLFAVSIFNKGGYILMAAIAMTCLLYVFRIRIDVTMLWLLLFSVSYSTIHILYFGFSFSDFCNHFAAPWGAYLVGKCYTRRFRHGEPLLRLMLAVAAGMFVHGTLNIFLQIFVFPNPLVGSRMAYDIWHGQYISVTGAGLLYTLMTGMAFGILFSECKVCYKILSLVIIGIAMLYSIKLAHRTTTVLIAIILLAYLYMRIIVGFRPTRRNILVLMLAVLAVIFLIACVVFDLFGLRTWITSQDLYLRLTNKDAANSGGRLTIWLSFLKQFLFYPMGGKHISLAENANYVHNMWFDIHYSCGILPFIAVLGATWSGFIGVLRVLKSRGRVSLLTRNCLFFVSIAFILNAAVEPVLEANPYFLFSYLMILGGAAGLKGRKTAGGDAQ